MATEKGDVMTNTERDVPVTGSTYDPSTDKMTQRYADNQRVSREHGKDHWTNQNFPKGHPDRHKKP